VSPGDRRAWTVAPVEAILIEWWRRGVAPRKEDDMTKTRILGNIKTRKLNRIPGDQRLVLTTPAVDREEPYCQRAPSSSRCAVG
jgi:hypothetical protein